MLGAGLKKSIYYGTIILVYKYSIQSIYPLMHSFHF
jgi:hypothetical protein